ncbi:hypothetical protein CAC42_377 [Sphaceloma murrayae]|uniref:Zn(2)-C6 fungal-type domain-containing protein n=1 Tax=Sphaceloma murrayae TaxID=2082308 RepID=A0A2K1R3D0_9PEZI|nr:hypothetical protein CAC42_377 [Sphaceloma murrayae]
MSTPSAPIPPPNKACEPCRALKVRCLPGTQGPPPVCQRCLKFDRVCNYALPQRRKQRKRTDARVAELEKEIVAMRALLEKTRPKDYPSPSSKSSPASVAQSTSESRRISLASDGVQQGGGIDIVDSGDIVGRGLISMEEADRLLHLYREDFVPHWPLVVLPPGQTASDLRRDQPLLFHAVMATAASKGRPDLFSVLSTEVMQDYVSRVLIKGQKSLEIVKAMMITCAWYFPTDRWSTLKFYEYSHLASTVAVDIGLGHRDTAHVPRDESDMKMSPETMSLDRKRSLLACYSQCASLSLNMRRPNMFHFTTYMAEIGKEFETSQNISTDDRALGAFVRIVNIGEELNVAFALTDGGREGVVSEEQLKQGVVTYQRRLSAWKEFHRPQLLAVDLQIMYHYMRVVLNEIPLHQFYPPSFFRPPYFLQGPIKQDPNVSEMSQHCFSQCVAAAHGLLDLLISQPVGCIRSLPTHIFPRAMFATIMLIAITLLPRPSDRQTSVAASGMCFETAQAESYLNALAEKLVEAAGMMEYRVPSVFAGPVVKARKWFLWAQDRQRRGLSTDGGLTFGLFTGPDDHPALVSDVRSENTSTLRGISGADEPSGRSTGPSLFAESPFIRLMDSNSETPFITTPMQFEASPTTDNQLPSTADLADHMHGIMPGPETKWLDELEQDYSTMLDPSLFESGAEFGDLAAAFQTFSPLEFTTGDPQPDGLQAFAGVDYSGMDMCTNLPGPMVRQHGSSYDGT